MNLCEGEDLACKRVFQSEQSESDSYQVGSLSNIPHLFVLGHLGGQYLLHRQSHLGFNQAMAGRAKDQTSSLGHL